MTGRNPRYLANLTGEACRAERPSSSDGKRFLVGEFADKAEGTAPSHSSVQRWVKCFRPPEGMAAEDPSKPAGWAAWRPRICGAAAPVSNWHRQNFPWRATCRCSDQNYGRQGRLPRARPRRECAGSRPRDRTARVDAGRTAVPDRAGAPRSHGARGTQVECRECHALYVGLPARPECGYRPPARARDVFIVPGRLVPLDAAMPGRESRADRMKFYRELRGHAVERNFRSGPPAHKYCERYGVAPA